MSQAAFVSTSLSPGLPVPETAADEASPDKKKKKKSKVRSAWISFIGRILAQMCGAVATVVLGLQLVRGYFPPSPPADAAGVTIEAAAPAVIPVRPGGMKVLAVLPVTNYSGDRRHDAFSDGLTDGLIAELARTPGIHITSRTSSMHFRDKPALLPTIARQLGVDFVLESSVVTSEGRRRITVQLIDAATDLHIWVQQYDSQDRDVLAAHSTIARAVARGVRAAGIGLED
jgi:TolB-like protein